MPGQESYPCAGSHRGIESFLGVRQADGNGYASWTVEGPVSDPSYQVRYRDPAGPCGTGFSGSNAWRY